jgi:pyruvate dehydrogenase E2 component (dihydrolipoamide acetyltransferase)
MAVALAARLRGDIHAASPLVMLHGFGAGGFAFDPVAPLLGGRVTTLCPDLPGHAGSLRHEGLGGAGRIAKAVMADLEERGVGAFHLAGHSLGGAVAVLIALRNPERVKSLTLIAPGGIGPEINHAALARYAEVRSPDDIASALVPFFAPGASVPAALVESMAAARKDPEAIGALQTILAAMMNAESGGVRQGVLPLSAMAALPMPIHVLWGDGDEILPVSQSLDLPGNVTVERIAGAGHMLMDEAAERVARVLDAQCA